MRRILAVAVLIAISGFGCQWCSETFAPKPNATKFSVNPMFSNEMVLQREMRVPIWGKGVPGEIISVQIDKKKYTATVDKDGKWMLHTRALPVGGPYLMKISGKKKIITLKNILSGDVWICSGQSNMQFSVARSKDAKKEIAAANYPNIRLFQVWRTVSQKPLATVKGKWTKCTPATVKRFSAVGYFFGRDLHKSLNVPIGLIHTSWGGTPAEAWTRQDFLKENPMLKPIMIRHHKRLKAYPQNLKKYKKQLASWKKKDGKKGGYHVDSSTKGIKGNWQKINLNDSKWKTMKLPKFWESKMNIDGVVWFRKTINIPANWNGKKLSLSLAMIDDFDKTYFNGVKIGQMGAENPDAWQTERKYTIPAKLVKTGKAIITVRVFDRFGAGGIHGDPNNMVLKPVNSKQVIKLAGNWKYKIALKLIPATLGRRPRAPYSKKHPHSAGGLYNAMINPLVPYGIKGAIWYQGESNASRAYQYRTLLPAMINCWRKVWNQGDFPFLIVELANYTKARTKPVNSHWAELREAQNMTAANLPACGIASAIDIGEARDVHPKNKQEVGKRLQLAALKVAYDKDIVFSGPTYKYCEIKGDKIIIKMDNIGGGLVAKGGALKRFAIAGKDKKFVWAKAVIKGSTVIVSSPKVKNPVSVRYAWSNNPDGCNLYNKEGLPAIPFRTDSWKGVTYKKR
jgi:sialate O-acetylesterase